MWADYTTSAKALTRDPLLNREGFWYTIMIDDGRDRFASSNGEDRHDN
jgi:hypothetical protein